MLEGREEGVGVVLEGRKEGDGVVLDGKEEGNGGALREGGMGIDTFYFICVFKKRSSLYRLPCASVHMHVRVYE